MMRTIVLAAVMAPFCTAITATGVFAQSIEVVGLDGKSVPVALATLEPRTVITLVRELK